MKKKKAEMQIKATHSSSTFRFRNRSPLIFRVMETTFPVLLIFPVLLTLFNISLAHSAAEPNETPWDDWANSQVAESDLPIVQNRQISKAGRFQIMGPLLGMSDRRDFYNTYIGSIAGRYHFNEVHGWEFLRATYSYPSATSLNTEIQEKTSFYPDVQLSKFQLSSSYVFSPIYGKYAWSSSHLVYFDAYGTLGGGLRFANDLQPFVEAGLGMNHYFFSPSFALVPEFRLRTYSEKRTNSTLVLESLMQLGVAWLF